MSDASEFDLRHCPGWPVPDVGIVLEHNPLQFCCSFHFLQAACDGSLHLGPSHKDAASLGDNTVCCCHQFLAAQEVRTQGTSSRDSLRGAAVDDLLLESFRWLHGDLVDGWHTHVTTELERAAGSDFVRRHQMPWAPLQPQLAIKRHLRRRQTGLLAWFAQRSGSGFSWDDCKSLINSEVNEMKLPKATRFYPVHFLNIVQLDNENSGEYIYPEVWSGGGDEPIVIMRDSFNSPQGFFLAAKGGRAADNHGNMDAGSFVFELDGVRWSIDPGNQSYNALEQIMGGELWNSAQDSRRWDLLTKNSGGHSTLVLNGEKHLADARVPLVRRELRGSIPQFTFDLSALYGDMVQGAHRTFSKQSESRLRISDELLFSPLTESLSWQMITRAELWLEEGGVMLEQDGATLYLRLPSEVPFEVKVVSLDPPPLPYDKEIEGLKRLEIHWLREDFQGNTAILNIELDSKPF